MKNLFIKLILKLLLSFYVIILYCIHCINNFILIFIMFFGVWLSVKYNMFYPLLILYSFIAFAIIKPFLNSINVSKIKTENNYLSQWVTQFCSLEIKKLFQKIILETRLKNKKISYLIKKLLFQKKN